MFDNNLLQTQTEFRLPEYLHPLCLGGFSEITAPEGEERDDIGITDHLHVTEPANDQKIENNGKNRLSEYKIPKLVMYYIAVFICSHFQ